MPPFRSRPLPGLASDTAARLPYPSPSTVRFLESPRDEAAAESWLADLFAGRNLGVILGAAQGGGGLGGFIGPFLGGWLFDVTGSYQIAFAVAAVAIAVSGVAAWVAAPRRDQAARRATGRIGP